MAELLTETEALAQCLGRVFRKEPTTFGADEAKLACGVLTDLFKADKVDADTFGRVNARIGNHSAMRQWAVKHSFIPSADAKDDALTVQTRKVMSELDAQEDARLEDATKPGKGK